MQLNFLALTVEMDFLKQMKLAMMEVLDDALLIAQAQCPCMFVLGEITLILLFVFVSQVTQETLALLFAEMVLSLALRCAMTEILEDVYLIVLEHKLTTHAQLAAQLHLQFVVVKLDIPFSRVNVFLNVEMGLFLLLKYAMMRTMEDVNQIVLVLLKISFVMEETIHKLLSADASTLIQLLTAKIVHLLQILTALSQSLKISQFVVMDSLKKEKNVMTVRKEPVLMTVVVQIGTTHALSKQTIRRLANILEIKCPILR